ncbi:cytochrome c-type biogenesis protein CcsB [Chromobacterium violaceum]|uniref:Cytochrome c-type biogenesis protein CcsB n=1 Tax=Chromobacterium violaceum TaxID=536 RepID=A0A447TLP1_CHRVL|nr:cytochrome c-type biogenesis protein CcsB [Chromobacterium violaceum]
MVQKGWLKDRLPAAEVLDEMMYQAISVGFLFFTIATILARCGRPTPGRLLELDPKETWR